MSDPMPYKWGGDGAAGDCSGRMRKMVQQKAAGMSIAEIEASFLEDMEPVMERIEERRVNDVIEAAAKVLFEDSGRKWADAEEWERNMERATAAVLHKAGMLVTGEEWRATGEDDNCGFETRVYTDPCPAYKFAAGGPVERRGITEWKAEE